MRFVLLNNGHPAGVYERKVFTKEKSIFSVSKRTAAFSRLLIDNSLAAFGILAL